MLFNMVLKGVVSAKDETCGVPGFSVPSFLPGVRLYLRSSPPQSARRGSGRYSSAAVAGVAEDKRKHIDEHMRSETAIRKWIREGRRHVRSR